MGMSDTAVKEANESEEEPEIITNEDENRKITAAEVLKKLDKVKNFRDVNGTDHLKIIFIEIIENVEQMKLKNQNKVKLEVSFDPIFYIGDTIFGVFVQSLVISTFDTRPLILRQRPYNLILLLQIVRFCMSGILVTIITIHIIISIFV